jgi:hypothetical protein
MNTTESSAKATNGSGFYLQNDAGQNNLAASKKIKP